MTKPMTNEQIAVVCHEANAEYCRQIGDNSQLPWDQSPQWQRDSAITGVAFTIANPTAPASSNHDSWLKEKLEGGWKYGPIKDSSKKEHPCCVPYKELPIEQQKKDALFRSIVLALS